MYKYNEIFNVISDVMELLQEVGVLSLGALAAPPACIAVGGKGEQIIVFQGVDKRSEFMIIMNR